MKEEDFLNSIEDLTGKVAVVTGGAKGIGLETTIYLAAKGATVYIASRNSESTQEGVAEARRRVEMLKAATTTAEGNDDDEDDDGNEKSIRFHDLDLGSMQGAWKSALELKKRIAETGTQENGRGNRLDILVCNAGVSMTTIRKLSPDGFDTMFAVNHLGHFAFTMGLIDLLNRTAETTTTHDARIVFTNSNAYKKNSTNLDYTKLSTPNPNDGKSFKDISDAFARYSASKLAAVYSAIELCKRLRQNGIEHVYVNSCHPGNAINTALGTGHQTAVNPTMERVIRAGLDVVMGNSTADSAKTQVYLAGSKYVKEHDTHGEFWLPSFSVLRREYKGCESEEYTDLAKDEKEREKLWRITVEAFKKAIGEDAIDSVEIVKNLIKDAD